jgi:hypothetical protein
VDVKRYADEILKALAELIWIDASYGVDIDSRAYDCGYQPALAALANFILDTHDPTYNGPDRE